VAELTLENRLLKTARSGLGRTVHEYPAATDLARLHRHGAAVVEFEVAFALEADRVVEGLGAVHKLRPARCETSAWLAWSASRTQSRTSPSNLYGLRRVFVGTVILAVKTLVFALERVPVTKREHEAVIAALQAQQKRLQNRREAIYIDKLDG